MFCHICHLTHCFRWPRLELVKPECQGELFAFAHTAKYAVCCISLVNPFCSRWGSSIIVLMSKSHMIPLPVRQVNISGMPLLALWKAPWVRKQWNLFRVIRPQIFKAGMLNVGFSTDLIGALGNQIPCTVCRHRVITKFLVLPQPSQAAIQWLIAMKLLSDCKERSNKM